MNQINIKEHAGWPRFMNTNALPLSMWKGLESHVYFQL